MKICGWILIVFSCFTFALSAQKIFDVLRHPIQYENEIISASKTYEIDPEIIMSVINVESSFKPNAKSKKNAIGLMQIKLSTANYLCDSENKKHLTESDLFTPKTNIDFGCKYLNYLMKKFDDKFTALAAYNAGETRVRSWLNCEDFSADKKTLKTIPFEETRNYVEKIKENIKFYKKLKFDKI